VKNNYFMRKVFGSGAIGDIGLNRKRGATCLLDRTSELIEAALATSDRHHRCTRVGELACRRRADATAGSCYERYCAVELFLRWKSFRR
jgi:hypothetical protein